MITKEILHEYVKYDFETGIFTWKKKSGDKCVIGGIVGGVQPQGYIQMQICGHNLRGHQAAWLYVYGYYPKQIDHKNRIKTDNRIYNLREVTSTQNLFNIGIKKDNTTGVKNVHWCNSKKRFIAKLKIKNKTNYIGSFINIEDAKLAIIYARNKLHGEYVCHE
jgi:hypothetical protein